MSVTVIGWAYVAIGGIGCHGSPRIVVFEEHLDGWYRVPGVWPSKRDLPTFQRWFVFSFHSMIVDLCDDDLEHEEL
jgi:hypothetical protein